MHSWKFLTVGMGAALTGMLSMAAPLSMSSQTSGPKYLPEVDRVCNKVLPGGTSYERWDRVFLATWDGKPLYVKVRAYYKPGSGEFLWMSTGLSEHGYASELKLETKDERSSCKDNPGHFLILQDGEWADFWAEEGRIDVFHCNLKFARREQAWDYIAQHWNDSASGDNESSKWFSEIVLYKELGRDFFRPKSLEFDARPYSYNSLVNVSRAGANWELEIKGADEPNRAAVLLDSDFKLIRATKSTDTCR